ncbi:MAG: MAPEG family protein [Sphingomonadales bacterium]|nr:MAPEG family protein [Sphingomonadales bacterium]
MEARMLAPAAALVIWSLIMLLWIVFTRFPAMAKLGLTAGTAKPGGRGQDLDGVLPDAVQWKSHNYTHLMEQPTIFYPTVVILAIVGPTSLDVTLAWAYVAIRIVHSLWQSLVNRLPVRITLFTLSTVCLLILALHAARLTILAA